MSQFVGKKCKNMFSLEGLIISQFTKLQTTNFMFENVYLFFSMIRSYKVNYRFNGKGYQGGCEY